jgi:hypothetical protein
MLCFQNPFVAAEQRPMVAHSGTVGFQSQTAQAPERGERNVLTACFLPPLPGLDFFNGQTHGFTVGYWLARFRR